VIRIGLAVSPRSRNAWCLGHGVCAKGVTPDEAFLGARRCADGCVSERSNKVNADRDGRVTVVFSPPEPNAEERALPNKPAGPARADFPFWWPVSVRWGDMDAMGHVNNIAYLQYLECARVGYFEGMGWNSRDVSPARQGPVMVRQTFNYRRQLQYPAEVEVGVACTEVRRRSFVLSSGLFRKESDELIGDGDSVLVWLDYAAGRAVEIPPDIHKHLTQG